MLDIHELAAGKGSIGIAARSALRCLNWFLQDAGFKVEDGIISSVESLPCPVKQNAKILKITWSSPLVADWGGSCYVTRRYFKG